MPPPGLVGDLGDLDPPGRGDAEASLTAWRIPACVLGLRLGRLSPGLPPDCLPPWLPGSVGAERAWRQASPGAKQAFDALHDKYLDETPAR